MNRDEACERRANRLALLGTLLLVISALPIWWVILVCAIRDGADVWLKLAASVLLFLASTGTHTRSRYWSERAESERRPPTTQTLPRPRWHGATSNNNHKN